MHKHKPNNQPMMQHSKGAAEILKYTMRSSARWLLHLKVMLQFPCCEWFSVGTVSWISDGYTGPPGFFFSFCQVSNVASFFVLLTHSLASCGHHQLCSNGNKNNSASRAVFTFDCGKFLIQWGLDSFFLSVCKLHYVEVITFILHGKFIRFFRGAVQFFRKQRCAPHWAVCFSFLFSSLLFHTSVF